MVKWSVWGDTEMSTTLITILIVINTIGIWAWLCQLNFEESNPVIFAVLLALNNVFWVLLGGSK